MKKAALVFAVTIALCLAAIGQEKQNSAKPHADAAALESNVRKVWKTYQAKDKAALASLLTDDFRQMEEGSPMGDKKAEVASVDELELLSFTLTDFTVKPIAPNAALVTYTAQYDSKTGNETAKAKSVFGEVWVRQGNEWKAMYVQETYLK